MVTLITLAVCDLGIPVIMVVISILFRKGGPKKINHFCGYRTSMSMKNKDTWHYAHSYCAKIWKKMGLVLFVMALIISICGLVGDNDIWVLIHLGNIILQLGFLIASVFIMERELYRAFILWLRSVYHEKLYERVIDILM